MRCRTDDDMQTGDINNLRTAKQAMPQSLQARTFDELLCWFGGRVGMPEQVHARRVSGHGKMQLDAGKRNG